MLYNYSKYALTMKLSSGFDFIIDDENRVDSNIF